MSLRRLVAVGMALVAVGGCAGSEDVSGDVRAVSDVTVRLRIDPARTSLGRTVRLSLTLMNNSGRPKRLVFDSGDRFDFWAVQDGVQVWRWSEAEAPVAGDATLEMAGQTSEQFAVTWTPPGAGIYQIHGEVLARGYEGELSARLTVEES
jgi:hypothetical protein